MSPGTAASSPLPLNGHRVNPLKVHPSAAVTRQSDGVGIGGGEWEEQKRRRKEKRQGEPVSRKSEAAARRSSRHAEGVKAEDLGLGFSSSHTRIENIRGSCYKKGRYKGFRGSRAIWENKGLEMPEYACRHPPTSLHIIPASASRESCSDARRQRAAGGAHLLMV